MDLNLAARTHISKHHPLQKRNRQQEGGSELKTSWGGGSTEASCGRSKTAREISDVRLADVTFSVLAQVSREEKRWRDQSGSSRMV